MYKVCFPKQMKNIKWGNPRSVIDGVFPNVSCSSNFLDLLKWKMGSAFISL